MTENIDLRNPWGVKWEGPFNTDTVTDLPYSVGSTNTSTVALDNNPFEHLDTFTGTFNDLGVNPNGIPGTEVRNIIP